MVRKCIAEIGPYTFLYQKDGKKKSKSKGLKLFIPVCVCVCQTSFFNDRAHCTIIFTKLAPKMSFLANIFALRMLCNSK